MFNTNRNRSYTNGQIIIYWQGGMCTHSTLCYSRLRSVFDPVRRPWINPLGASTDQILQIIEQCPTDALTFRWNDERRNRTETSKKLFIGDAEKIFGPLRLPKLLDDTTAVAPSQQDISPLPEPAVKVDLRPNGPIVISGQFEVNNHDGQPIGRVQMISLCRCGQSKNMPYCDGTHFKVGFHTTR